MSDPTDEQGLGAAWEHLKLAVLALWQPLQPQLQLRPTQLSTATRIYLLNNAMIYGIAAMAFLLPLHQFRIPVTGLALVDGRLPHILWGLSVLVVCLSQIAALFTNRWSVWVLTTVGTAMWASCWAVVTLLLAYEAGNYAGAALWMWLVVVHFLFINNQLVPLPESVVSPQEAAAAMEERRLIERFTRVVKDDSDDGDDNGETEPIK